MERNIIITILYGLIIFYQIDYSRSRIMINIIIIIIKYNDSEIINLLTILFLVLSELIIYCYCIINMIKLIII